MKQHDFDIERLKYDVSGNSNSIGEDFAELEFQCHEERQRQFICLHIFYGSESDSSHFYAVQFPSIREKHWVVFDARELLSERELNTVEQDERSRLASIAKLIGDSFSSPRMFISRLSYLQSSLN